MAIDSAALDELRRGFRGELLTTQNLGYEDARLVWNAMVARLERDGGQATDRDRAVREH